VKLALHPDAEAAIRSRTDMAITPQRLRMGEFPVGSHIIPNPYNKIPGFSMGDHHFVPGFPVMAWPHGRVGAGPTLRASVSPHARRPRLPSSSMTFRNPPSRRS